MLNIRSSKMATLGQLLPTGSGAVLNSRTLLPSPFPSLTTTRNFRVKMSIPATQASIVLPENRIILGCGSVGVDFLAAVASYPNPDDKIRSTSFQVQGGGNTGNALTCAARLGLTPRVISKVSNDSQGKGILEELEADGVDSSFIVVSDGGNSPFTYIIVDNQTKTRTCIHTPGYPPMIPTDLSQSNLFSSLDGAKLVYFDGRLHETAAVVAEEANRRGIPILIDAERKREGLDHLLSFASYVVCSTKFPQEWTEASSIPSALLSMLLRLPKVKFVIVTLGEDGCLMLQRTEMDNLDPEERDVDDLFEKLNQKKDTNATSPACISSNVAKLHAKGIGTISAICANMPPEKMLPFAAQVAAIKCRALGARAGLPHYTDPRLTPFLV
nr:ribokinase-like isoform X3 [Nicotiana tomentosiformis]